jgi:succinate dehydrogenase/fumarate reductase-like Fe-S protein
LKRRAKDGGAALEVKLFRYDPQVDTKPRYELYQVPYEGRSVLDMLRYIYENYDSSLAYREGCMGKGPERCGACAVLVNGVAALSCQRAGEKRITVEPHPKFELIKDLVVSFSRVREKKLDRQVAVEITIDVEKCVGCQDCVRICPVSVYTMKRENGKLIANPEDTEACCGPTCLSCVVHCWQGAISLKDITIVNVLSKVT